MRILTARHLLPITSAPLEHGAIAIEGDVIVSVGSRPAIVAEYPEASIEDYGAAAILPGFVNCHSHLEITSMRNALDDVEHDFTSWLLKLTALRKGLSPEEIEAAALRGALEGARAGVTSFGDIGRFGAAGISALKSAGLRGVLFQETEFSPSDEMAEVDFAALKEKFFALRSAENNLVKVGLSPHSPYTVSRRLFELISDFALSENIKISIHAAESAEEHELMTVGSGFFREHYEKFGVEWRNPNCTSVAYLDQTGILETRPLLAHCITVSDQDIETIIRSGSRIAHCPKSNAKFGHGVAPLEAFLDAGAAVGLGSDSVASNNMCDMLEESRFAALAARNRLGRKRFVTAKEMIETATLGGAKALGLDEVVGSLEAGKQADVAVVSLEEGAQNPVNDIHGALVFASSGRDVVMTMVAGTVVYRRET